MSSLVKKVHSIEQTLRSITKFVQPTQNKQSLPSSTRHQNNAPTSSCSQQPLPSQKIQSKISFPTITTKSPSNPYTSSDHISPIPKTESIPIQTKLRTVLPTDNEWVGSKICPLQKNEIRLWLQNINGFDISHNFQIFMEHFQYLKKYEISFFSIPESKLNPYSAYVSENIEEAMQRIYPASCSNLSNQFLNHEDLCQYGGIFSAIVKSLTHRVAGKGKDQLGRFNWIDFYGADNFLRIYTIYRVNPGNDSSSGDDTCWTHQRTALTLKNCNIDPRKQVILDLVKQIKEDIRLHRSILICGDVNEDITKNSGFNKAMLDLGLFNVVTQEIGNSIEYRTHNRGKSIIDGIWASPNLQHSIIRCGAAPFNFAFQSDHRGLFLDINLQDFLDVSNCPLLSPAYRRLKFTIPKRVQAYSTQCLSLWKLQKMNLRLSQLEELLPISSSLEQSHLLNKLDAEIGDILTSGEKKCCTVGRHCTDPFSRELQKALRNNRQCKFTLAKLLASYGSGSTPSVDIKHAAEQKRLAARHLKHCQKNAKPLRDQMLDELAKDTMMMHPSRGKKKLSVIKQLRNCETSRIDATKIRFATKGPRPGAISYVLVPALSSYSTVEQSQPAFDYLNIDTIWERTQRNNGKDIEEWTRIDDIKQVTTLVTQILRKHFGQSTGTPFANMLWKKKLADPDFQTSLLDGTFQCDTSLPEEANDLLQSFTRKDKVKEIPLLPTWKEFLHFINNAKEKTSASPSGRHYGHYKSLAHSAPSILRGIFKIYCLSLQYGVVLERWKKTITTVICKDDNTPYIHRLRPLHIVEAELQFFSKLQWSHHLIKQAEHLNHISPTQYGGRKNRQAQSSVINTILSFDIHRQLRTEYTFNDDDLRANYDRELAHYSAAETRSHGLSFEAGKLLIDITTNQKFHIKTINGVSPEYYSFSSSHPVWGLGQGISWAGSCWQFTATSIQQCLEKTCCGAKLNNPLNTISINPFLKFFIDDTTKICNYTNILSSILEQTKHNMQKHLNYVTSTGGTLALDKCRFYFIKFGFDKDHNPYILSIDENPGDLTIFDNIEQKSITIRRVEANEERRTLGCFISPANVNTQQFAQIKKFILEWTKSMKFSSLSPTLILKAYDTILKPKLVYRLSTTSFTFDQCDELVKLLRPTILHAHRTHEHFPTSILESPSTYAGFNFTHIYDLQGYEKYKFFIYHLRQLDDTGTAILISMQYTQLMLGIQQLFLNADYNTYSLLSDKTWCTNLWEYTHTQDLKVDISHAISIPLQRANDVHIMDLLYPHYSPNELQKLNKIRIHLKLLFLSDMLDVRGRHILPDIKNGVSHRTSSISFPLQSYSKSWLSLWRKACNTIDKYASNHPLGAWHKCYLHWNASLSTCHQYLRVNNTLYSLHDNFSLYIASTATLTQNISFTIPADIHTTKRGFKVISTYSEYSFRPSNLPTYDPFTLFGEFHRDNEMDIVTAIQTNKAKMCCDGSVLNSSGSFAYGIASSGSDQCLFQQHAPVHGDKEQITSTRCELMGLLACVEYLRYLSNKYSFPRKNFILITADNEVAIKAPKKSYLSTKHTFSPDMDIILHLIHLLQSTPFHIKFQHVRGHQDKHNSYDSLSTIAKLNIQMDKLAKQFFSSPTMAPKYSLDSPFLFGSTVSIRDSHSRIVKSFSINLRRHSTGLRAEQQLAKSLHITLQTLPLMDWSNFSSSYSTKPRNIKSFVTKSLYRQLPTMHRQYTWKLANSESCPLCSSSIDNSDHLFQCTHVDLQAFRRKKIQSLKDELVQLGTDPFIIRHLIRLVLQWTNRFPVNPIPIPENDQDTTVAINEQIKLGVGNFLRGALVWRLAVAQDIYFKSERNFSSNSNTWARKIISFLFQMSHDIWTRRCTLIADSKDQTYESQIRQNCKTLHIQLSRTQTNLPVSYRHLLDRKPSFTHTSTIRALQSWLTRINAGLNLAKSGQKRSTSDIRNWFSTSNVTPSNGVEETEINFSTSNATPDSNDSFDLCSLDDSISRVTSIRTVPYLPYIAPQPIHTQSTRIFPLPNRKNSFFSPNQRKDTT